MRRIVTTHQTLHFVKGAGLLECLCKLKMMGLKKYNRIKQAYWSPNKRANFGAIAR